MTFRTFLLLMAAVILALLLFGLLGCSTPLTISVYPDGTVLLEGRLPPPSGK